MKPAPFLHRFADDAAHAVALLAEYGDEARILAGGQSLIPMMALRLARPEVLVDITRAADLGGLAVDADVVHIGAAVTGRRVERDEEVGVGHPLLTTTLGFVSHAEIRNRGTVCGSIAHADPAAELPAVLLATDGQLEVGGPAGRRLVPADAFFMSPYTTSLAEGEVLLGAQVPRLPSDVGWAVDELARRRGDFALAGCVAVLSLDEGGCADDVRIALFGLAGRAVRASEAEQFLRGRHPDEAAIGTAARSAVAEVQVVGDLHGSAAFRRTAGAVVVERTLRTAVARAAAGVGEVLEAVR